MKVGKETVTPKKAMEWLKRNIHNRPLSATTVRLYESAMKAGVWQLNGDPIRFNGNGDLIDGQHRLTACVQAGTPFESVVIRGIEHDAFDTIDQGRKRTIGDVFARKGYKHYVTLASAVRWIWLYATFMSPGSRGARSMRSDEANEILEQHPGLHHAVEVARGLGGNQRKLIHSGSLAFLIYATSCQHDDPESVERFWSSVICAEGLERGSPAYKLHQRLVLNLGSVAKLHSETVTALAIKAWNAHTTGKTCGVLRWSQAEEFPEIIGFSID